jgi:hypothetical protein
MAVPVTSSSSGDPTGSGGSTEGTSNMTSGAAAPASTNPASTSVPGASVSAPSALQGNNAPSSSLKSGEFAPNAVGSVNVMAGCPICGTATPVAGFDGHVRGHGVSYSDQFNPGYTQGTPGANPSFGGRGASLPSSSSQTVGPSSS